MAEPTDQWLSVHDAASALGISEDAVRSKIKRRTLRSRRGNDGRVSVLVGDQPSDHWSAIGRPLGDQPNDRPIEGAPQNRQPPVSVPDVVPVAVVREMLDASQRASSESLAALQAQHREHVDQLRTDHTYQIAKLRDEAYFRDEQHRRAAKGERLWMLLYMILALVVVALTGPWARH